MAKQVVMANTNIFRVVVVAAAVVVASQLIAASQARTGAAIVSMNRQRFLGSFLSSATLVPRPVLVLVVCVVAPLACLGQSYGGGNVALAAEAGKKPNILFILTDDADLSLLPKMPQIEEQLILKGTIFPNAFAPFATCCPSRATILPGAGHDAKDKRLVSGVDLMPTFLELADAPTPEYVDGRSLVPLLSGTKPPWRDSLLLEGYDDGFENKPYVPPDFKAIRTSDGRTYVEYETGEREMYDLSTDPRQLRSLHDEPERAVEESALSARLQALKYCSGEGCRCAEVKPIPRPHCSPYPPWRSHSALGTRSFIQEVLITGEASLNISLGGARDPGINRRYRESLMGNPQSL